LRRISCATPHSTPQFQNGGVYLRMDFIYTRLLEIVAVFRYLYKTLIFAHKHHGSCLPRYGLRRVQRLHLCKLFARLPNPWDSTNPI